MAGKSKQEAIDEIHSYADDIHELRTGGVGDRQAKPEDYHTDDHNWWHRYYKNDVAKYGGDAPTKNVIKRALKHLKDGSAR